MDKVVHFEIPAEDVPRARRFYGAVFGWELHDHPTPAGTYTIAQTVLVDERRTPTEPGAIDGGPIARSPVTPNPVITIQVDSIDETLGTIQAAGGRVVQGRIEPPGMGALAYFEDPEGNTLGLWETAR